MEDALACLILSVLVLELRAFLQKLVATQKGRANPQKFVWLSDLCFSVASFRCSVEV